MNEDQRFSGSRSTGYDSMAAVELSGYCFLVVVKDLDLALLFFKNAWSPLGKIDANLWEQEFF